MYFFSNHSNSPFCARLRAENVQAIKSLADLPVPTATSAGSLPLRKVKKRPAEPPISKIDSQVKWLGLTSVLWIVKFCVLQDSEVSCAISPSDSPSRKGLASSLRGLFGTMPGSPVLVHPTPRCIAQSAPTSAINSPLKVRLLVFTI